MKEIKRYNLHTEKVETFRLTGQWADGHYAYTRIGDEGTEDEGMYAQVRENGKLCMLHI